ncbi:MAG: hypothetical protein IPL46_21860 [Saprospiraceae bacterium]|nr:hypothetical protein [Saprospiraceae bacterium]
MMLLPGNEVAQVHRYLDLGAKMEICQAPMDNICASAIQELLSYHPAKPVILAETGAVEPGHAGPSKYYPLDTAGILLHDILFAPFFSGSAGAGMSWHWESYVHKNNLWYHYQRFSEASEGIDPIEEAFVPSIIATDSLRIYQLRGKKTNLLWLRDSNNTWQSELDHGIPAQTRQGVQLLAADLGISTLPNSMDVYDPWQNIWSKISRDDLRFRLPDFKRSIIVRWSME